MGKITPRIHRKDQVEDHGHKLPDGTMTGGMLLKPNSDRSFPHTHLYQKEGKTLETEIAKDTGDHVHRSESGTSGGPLPLKK